jgi:mono/diheme cytochrome c family protein
MVGLDPSLGAFGSPSPSGTPRTSGGAQTVTGIGSKNRASHGHRSGYEAIMARMSFASVHYATSSNDTVVRTKLNSSPFLTIAGRYGLCIEAMKTRKDGGCSMRRAVVVVLLLSGSAGTGLAQDLQNGAKWATDVCGQCHAVRSGQARSPNGRAPTFVELANTPGMTAAALTVALTTPHAGMPMFVLTPEQRQDIIAHVLCLKSNR